MSSTLKTGDGLRRSAWGPAGIVLALWLMLDFALPKTLWASLSVTGLLCALQFGPGHPTDLTVLLDSAGDGFGALLAVWGLFLCTWASYHPRREEPRAGRVLWLAVAAYTAVYFVSAVSDHAHGETPALGLRVIGPLTLGLLAARVCLAPARAMAVLVVLVAAQAAYALALLAGGRDILWSGTLARAGGTYGQPTALYTAQLCALPAAVVLAATDMPPRRRALWGTFAALMLLALVAAWDRTAMVAVSVGLLWVLTRVRLRRGWGRLLCASLLVCCVLIAGVRLHGRENRISTAGSLTSRRTLWRQGWRTFLAHPVAGVGVTHLRLRVPSQVSRRVYTLIEPKNLALHWLAEMGVGGLLLLLTFLLATGALVGTGGEPARVGIGGAWVALLVAGLTDTPFGVADRICQNGLVGFLLGATLLLSAGTVSPMASADAPGSVNVGEST